MSVSGGTMSGRRVAPDAISATLALLQDTQKFEARLKQLNTAESKLRETTDKYEKIVDLNRSRASAKRAKERAEEALVEAEAMAKIIVRDAEENSSAARQVVQSEKAEFDKAARDKSAQLRERESTLANDEADYTRRYEALERRDATISKKGADNQSRKRDLDRMANSLKAVCNEILA